MPEILPPGMEAATRAVLSHPWGSSPITAHKVHKFDIECAVCQGDVARVLPVALTALADHAHGLASSHASEHGDLRQQVADRLLQISDADPDGWLEVLDATFSVVGPELRRLTLAYNAADAMRGVHKRRADRLRMELEHAQAALAGDNEAVRLFMADCTRTAERHRERANLWQRAAEQTEGIIDRVWEWAKHWQATRPLDEIDWELLDPNEGHRAASRDILAILDQATSEEQTGSDTRLADPALRNCLVPGCLKQYDAIAALCGYPPARPEWSSEGWRVMRSGGGFPVGGHICPAHVEVVTAHLPGRVPVETGWVQAACVCGGWTSPRVRWHGAVRALWEEHLLVDALHAFAPAAVSEEQTGGDDVA